MAFRIGQKCVYIGGGICTEMRYPKKDEIVTIGCEPFEKFNEVYVSLVGFEYCDDGNKKYFATKRLRPLELDYEFVKEVIKQVTPKEQEA